MFTIDQAIKILNLLAGGERPMARIPKVKAKAKAKAKAKFDLVNWDRPDLPGPWD